MPQPLIRLMLVVTDPVNITGSLISDTIRLAINKEAELNILCVLPEIAEHYASLDIPKTEQSAISTARSHLQHHIDALDTQCNIPADKLSVDVVFGKPFIEIIRHCKNRKISLVIKEATKESWLRRMLGSSDMHLLRKCPVPVLLLREPALPPPENILIAVDFDRDDPELAYDPLNKRMLELSIALFDSSTTHYTLLNVYASPQAGFVGLFADDPETAMASLEADEKRFKQGELNMLLHYLQASYISPPVFKRVFTSLIQGRAEEQIPRQVQQSGCDLLVMGTVARTGIPGLLIGNTAEDVLLDISCNVLALKPPGFVSPVT
ncbi:universal stress protein [Salinimonas chungwhensis]|uniref:universal stress protein n=1 Tax=Salinimonas chungwhensis TaxID=265425 RepID=UPI000369C171|nr:universal stress protein [Salinimonas chungwhensis]